MKKSLKTQVKRMICQQNRAASLVWYALAVVLPARTNLLKHQCFPSQMFPLGFVFGGSPAPGATANTMRNGSRKLPLLVPTIGPPAKTL